MNLTTLTAFGLLKQWAPFPWSVASDNDSGMEVMDCTGKPIFSFDAGAIPDEWPSHMRTEEITRQKNLGRFLVDLSHDPTP